MFSLGVKDGKLHDKPHIPMLRENNTRRGFFEPEQFEAVCECLPEALPPVVTFAYLTGWRVKSEIFHSNGVTLVEQVDFFGWVRDHEERRRSQFFVHGGAGHAPQERLGEHERLKKENDRSARLSPRRRTDSRFPQSVDVGMSARRVSGPTSAPCPAYGSAQSRKSWCVAFSGDGMVGHKTEAIYRRYAIVDAGALRDAAASPKLVPGAGIEPARPFRGPGL